MGAVVEETRPLNLHWGKPAAALLPIQELAAAAQRVFSDPSISTVSLQYGDGRDYQPLRECLSSWLSEFNGSQNNPNHICITGGASQGMATILQVLTDRYATKAVWMVTPCFHLACSIFEDAGLTDRLRGVAEGKEGFIDRDSWSGS